MDLYTFADPEDEVYAILKANAARFPVGTKFSTAFPLTLTDHHHVQFAWDGTPGDEQQREFATIRVTYWTPKGHRSEAKDGASLARAVLLDSGTSGLWRITRGGGRAPGHDDATGNEFCTFNVTAETRPSAVL